MRRTPPRTPKQVVEILRATLLEYEKFPRPDDNSALHMEFKRILLERIAEVEARQAALVA
jgi:hypothetical protein